MDCPKVAKLIHDQSAVRSGGHVLRRTPLEDSTEDANTLVRTEQATDDIRYSESARQGQDR